MTNGIDATIGNGRRPVLGQNTLVPIGAVIAVLGSLLAGGMWLDARFDALEMRMMEIERTVGDRWTGNDMKLWSEMLQRQNPSHCVPDPWEIVKHREN